MPCGPRRGRDDRQPSQTASLESTAHNWPIAESAMIVKTNQERKMLKIECIQSLSHTHTDSSKELEALIIIKITTTRTCI